MFPIDDIVDRAAEAVESASGKRYIIPNAMVQAEVDRHINEALDLLEMIRGTINYDGPPLWIFRDGQWKRILGRIFPGSRHIQMYEGWMLQDLAEELLHLRQSIRDGFLDIGLPPDEIADVWEAQVDNFFRNIGMIPKE